MNMPSRSNQAAPTSHERQPVTPLQRRRREPHPRKDVSNPRPGSLDQSRTYTPLDSPHVPLRNTPDTLPPPQRHNMRSPSTEGEEIRVAIPQDARSLRGSRENELERPQKLESQATLSGPIRTRRNPSRGVQPQRGSHGISRTPVHNAHDYRFAPLSASSDPYLMHQSAQPSPYDMQVRSQQQHRQDFGGSRHVMHQEPSSHHSGPHQNMTSSFQDARALEAQPMPSTDIGPRMHDMQHNVNQQPGYSAAHYAMDSHPNYAPDQQGPTQAVNYDQNAYASQHATEGWSQRENSVDGAEVVQSYPMRQPSGQQQMQHWNQAPPLMYSTYSQQQGSSTGPIRHAQHQLQHQRAHSISQPYPRPNNSGHERPASMSGMHSRHASMPSQGQNQNNLTSSPTASFVQSPSLSLGASPLGLSFSGKPVDQGAHVIQYNPMSRQYSTGQGQTQSPTQYVHSHTHTSSIGLVPSLRRQSSLGIPPGLKCFGSPEGVRARLVPPPPTELNTPPMQGGSAQQESGYPTSAPGFQASRLGGQADIGGASFSSSVLSSPYFSHATQAAQTSASESPGVSQAPEVTYSGRRERRKDPRPHKCPECAKGFPRPSALATHMSVHSGDKPYNCPVVSCNKSFAVRSNARRHLKTHGIKLKTRDRSSKSTGPQTSVDQRAESSADEGENDNETDDNAELEPPTSASQRRVSTIPVNALARPPDRGLGLASHRGHANPHSNVHVDPFGLGTSLSLIKGEHSGTVLEHVKRGGNAGEKRNRWEMEMSGGVRLRTVRKGVATGRSRRGLRSDDMVSKARRATDGDDSFQEDEEEGDTVHELEEDALLRLCPQPEEPTTPQMPHLDKADLDKLIAPPLAWDGFQKQKRLEESGQNLTLEQRLAFHAGASGSADLLQVVASSNAQQNGHTIHPTAVQSVTHGTAEPLRRESTSTMASSTTLRSSPSAPAAPLTETEEAQTNVPTVEGISSPTGRGAPSMGSFFPRSLGGGGSGSDPRSQIPSFLTSSMRTSTAPLGPATSVPPSYQCGVGNFSSPSPGSGSGEEAIESFREDGTWAPASMSGYVNVGRLRNSEPFDDLGLSSVQLQIPLPAVQPRQIRLPGGGGKYDERNSYAPDIGLYPYHPAYFNRRPILAGPAPPSLSAPIAPWRSAIIT